MRVHTIILTAGQQLNYDVVGTMAKVLSATGTFTLRAESRKSNAILSDDLEMSAGSKVRFDEEPFDLVRLTDTSGAGNTIRLLVGTGDHDSDSVVGSISVSNTAATTLDSSADVTLATANSHDIAANAARRELVLEADATNTGDLFIRDQSATTSEGKRLKPGETVFLSFKGALRIRNNSGANQTFGIVELTG
jgi:hypothetical protein